MTEASATERREQAERFLADHGEELYRYCVSMLGSDGAAEVLATICGHVEEVAPTLEQDGPRLTILAIAHNRCVERSRTGGKPPTGDGLPPDQARAVAALGELRPIGRDLLVLRATMGLRWDELQRVCGVPQSRLVLRVCRAWRRLRQLAEVPGSAAPGERPRSEPLPEPTNERAWQAIRDDARPFVELRQRLRQARASLRPEEGWLDAAWERREQQLVEEQEQAEQRAAERAAQRERAEARAKETREAEAASFAGATDDDTAADPSGGAFSNPDDEPTPRVRSMSLRWITVGVLLAVVGLAARWLMLR